MYRSTLISSLIILFASVALALFNPPLAWLCFLTLATYWFVYGLVIGRKLRQVAKKHGIKLSNKSSQYIQALDETLTHSEKQLIEMLNAFEKIGGGQNIDNSTELTGEARQSVISLQQKLGNLKDEETKRMWAVEGLARINEIRKKQNSLEAYAVDTISILVKYLSANQGCFYLLNESDKGEEELHLLATYAYNKRKYSDRIVRVEVGTGLLGQSVLEKDLIFIKEAPRDYVKITSGLGEALPRCIAIVPLIFREQVYGVIEMASFHEFEKHHLDFIRKVSETIASELSGIRIGERTGKLLEQAQHQANELRSQEEELRQNMEEMKATEEAMKRKEIELQRKLKEVETERKKNEAILNGCMDGVISFTDEGSIVFANEVAQEIFGRLPEELLGNQVGSLLPIHIHENGQGKKVVNRTGNEVTIRTEVLAENTKGEELSLLLTATKVEVEEKTLFTIFIQKISVDLF